MDTEEMRNAVHRAAVLTVSEIFGPTLQGEGRSQGMHTMFLRLGLCNLDCKWCDTPYTWDWQGKNGTAYSKEEQLKRMSVADILDALDSDSPRVVITGGEPMVQQASLVPLIKELHRQDRYVEIETNGTLMPSGEYADLGALFNVSPKLSNSGVPRNKAINLPALAEYYFLGASFKFVVESDDCIREVISIARDANIPHRRIWLMPQGTTSTVMLEQLPWLFDRCAELGFNLSARLHVLAHNDKRGI
jgi:7-carboxy-7-deazaguanine synthase